MRGNTYKRCSCTDADGRLLGRRCRQLHNSRHGSWYYALWIPKLDGSGRRQVRGGGFPNERAAAKALTVLVGKVDAGTYIEATRLTVSEYLAEWLIGKANLRPSTRKSSSWSRS